MYTSFREGVAQASGMRRVAVLTLCGAVAGSGWWLLKRFGKPQIEIKAALKQPLQGLPFLTTVFHVLLQIITVGLGSPLGREVAPREMTAAFASAGGKRLGLDEGEMRLLIACASGAGLAAVYNVPLASTLFILEAMLGVWTQQAAAAALLTSVIATAVARIGLGDVQQYHPANLAVNTSLLWFSAVIGPILGATAVYFRRSAEKFPFLKRDNPRIIPLAIALFALIGAIAVWFPEILGNGKAGNQLTFGGLTDWQHSLELTAVKWLVVLMALAAGAYGGLITPSMMLGSTISFAAAAAWNSVFPEMPSESAAVVGAAVFLGVSLNMPLTAAVFILELTYAPAALLMPLCTGMAGAVWTARKMGCK
ncbi:chloride transporter%2C ClC family [Neisseria meningitidis]|uniref:Chloride channel protein n=1 Tax=Neisseria meningitidis TaxID=487 RepID=A0A0Y6V553_NEIME|nr:chloride channel protein [Neisseria meningitidis]AIZ20409.1 chloride channel protein [Neisseria meningitidis M7124]ELK58672.1 voltage gated chloride channel family protein [Neisseria meningitidis 87255]ELK82542.1 voltage gated chloride channel family protein [Neisseria meningitidis NM586]ELK86080.1 voltage gated chloride channel family protein [Neisseria meningitidis NM762]ELK89816.1 voltage gated chloride channel family protein [Neisseria meningitidis M7089]ELK91676.1 voltage gated chlori